MSEARDQILGTIRETRARTVPDDEAQAVVEARLQTHRRGTTPARDDRGRHELVELYAEQADKISVTIDRIPDASAAPGAIADYLARENLPATLRAAPDPALESLPWDSRPALTVSYGRTDGGDDVGLTPAFCAVAETGTLMLRSDETHPTTLNFLPDTHIVLLRASQIVGPYEDAWDRLRANGAMPRTVNFIGGPSRTADIEQTIQLGAHGPRRLHVVLIEDLADE